MSAKCFDWVPLFSVLAFLLCFPMMIAFWTSFDLIVIRVNETVLNEFNVTEYGNAIHTGVIVTGVFSGLFTAICLAVGVMATIAYARKKPGRLALASQIMSGISIALIYLLNIFWIVLLMALSACTLIYFAVKMVVTKVLRDYCKPKNLTTFLDEFLPKYWPEFNDKTQSQRHAIRQKVIVGIEGSPFPIMKIMQSVCKIGNFELTLYFVVCLLAVLIILLGLTTFIVVLSGHFERLRCLRKYIPLLNNNPPPTGPRLKSEYTWSSAVPSTIHSPLDTENDESTSEVIKKSNKSKQVVIKK